MVECGVAKSGTTLFLADLLDVLGEGKVYGIDRDLQSIDWRAAQHPRIRPPSSYGSPDRHVCLR